MVAESTVFEFPSTEAATNGNERFQERILEIVEKRLAEVDAQPKPKENTVERLQQSVKKVDILSLTCMLFLGAAMLFVFSYTMLFGALTGHIAGIKDELPGAIRFVFGFTALFQVVLVVVIDTTAIELMARKDIWKARGKKQLYEDAVRYINVTLAIEIATFVLAMMVLSLNPIGLARGESLIKGEIPLNGIGMPIVIPFAFLIELVLTAVRGYLIAQTIRLRNNIGDELPPDIDTFVYEMLSLLGGQTSQYIKGLDTKSIEPDALVKAFTEYAIAIRYPPGAILSQEEEVQKRSTEGQATKLVEAFSDLRQSDSTQQEQQEMQERTTQVFAEVEEMRSMMQQLQEMLANGIPARSGKPRTLLTIPANNVSSITDGTIRESALKDATGKALCTQLGIQLSTTPKGKNGAWINANNAMQLLEDGTLTFELVEAAILKLAADDNVKSRAGNAICRVAKLIPVLAEKGKLITAVQEWHNYQLDLKQSKAKSDTSENEKLDGEN